MAKPKLMTSNKRKIEEMRRLGLDAEMGGASADLPEVLADPVEVVVRKSEMNGAGTVVEDTSLDVEGGDFGVEIKWLLSHLPEMDGKRAVFRVVLGLNDGSAISVFKGRINGFIDGKRSGSEDAFGFDPWFVPDGSEGKSLYELEKEGRKDEFSARALAVSAFNSSKSLVSVPLSSLKEWKGEWQTSSSPVKKIRKP